MSYPTNVSNPRRRSFPTRVGHQQLERGRLHVDDVGTCTRSWSPNLTAGQRVCAQMQASSQHGKKLSRSLPCASWGIDRTLIVAREAPRASAKLPWK
jgi:hypothetical protein